MKHSWIAAAPFGVEGIVARELKDLGFAGRAQNGGVVFEADQAGAFLANMHLRAADRISLLLGKFPARSFEELFEGVYAIDWPDILPENACFPVTGKCVRAQLMSLPDCQSIAKKAIVKKMQRRYKRDIFPEDGANYRVQIALTGEECIVSLNASGDALNKRGYRKRHTEAPLRETLAAALLLTTPTAFKEIPFFDPMCGSGTFAVELAMMRYDRVPGLYRSFDCENWQFMPKRDMADIREAAIDAFYQASSKPHAPIWASDIDGEAVEIAQSSARDAGLANAIQIAQRDARDLAFEGAGLIVTNPPYGERLGDSKDAEDAAVLLGTLFKSHSDSVFGILTALPGFEKRFARRAFRRRRVYNGRIECEYMCFSR